MAWFRLYYGSEFINEHLWAFCQAAQSPIQFTRPRPYKKDDNAHVEQNNWTHVRKLVGWERYDSADALDALNALYTELRLFQNLLQPSMKLVRKVRVGARLIRRYDAPQTPWTRLLASAAMDAAKRAALQRVIARTDPFTPSARIDAQLEQVWALATRGSRQPRATAPQRPQPRGVMPWRGWVFSAQVKQARHQQRRSLGKMLT